MPYGYLFIQELKNTNKMEIIGFIVITLFVVFMILIGLLGKEKYKDNKILLSLTDLTVILFLLSLIILVLGFANQLDKL